jgi:hypothetical protein
MRQTVSTEAALAKAVQRALPTARLCSPASDEDTFLLRGVNSLLIREELEEMKLELSLQERESLLRQLRIAVALQIQLWDVTLVMAEELDCGLEEIQPASLPTLAWNLCEPIWMNFWALTGRGQRWIPKVFSETIEAR